MFRVVAHFGFAEDPEVPPVLELLREKGLEIDLSRTTFFLGRETLIATDRPGLAIWRERLFARLTRNSQRVTKFYQLPSDRVCELGAEIEL
jgi:KUP system potassium uptake protein